MLEENFPFEQIFFQYKLAILENRLSSLDFLHQLYPYFQISHEFENKNLLDIAIDQRNLEAINWLIGKGLSPYTVNLDNFDMSIRDEIVFLREIWDEKKNKEAIQLYKGSIGCFLATVDAAVALSSFNPTAVYFSIAAKAVCAYGFYKTDKTDTDAVNGYSSLFFGAATQIFMFDSIYAAHRLIARPRPTYST